MVNEGPRSNYVKIKCVECEAEQVVFNRASIVVKCNMCGSTLAEPTGGKIKPLGKVTGKVDG